MANLIVQENLLLGSPDTEWDLAGAASTNIEGFATDISFNRGDTVSFKINTNSANYRIDIYRLGYYGGRGARKLATLLQTTASVQPPPIINSSIGLVDAGNWHVSEYASVNDLSNRRYIGSVIVNETNSRYFEPEPGRTVYLMISASRR